MSLVGVVSVNLPCGVKDQFRHSRIRPGSGNDGFAKSWTLARKAFNGGPN